MCQCWKLLLIVSTCVSSSIIGRADEASNEASSKSPVTYNRDIAPMIFQHCTSCHRDGEVGPFALISFDDVSNRADQIAEVLKRGLMPPWKPSDGSDVFKYARKLDQPSIDLFMKWLSDGKQEGEAADLPKAPDFPAGWQLGPPDMVLEIDKPFTVPAEGDDIYIHFVIPSDRTQDKYVSAVQILPQNRKVAHHGVIMLDTRGEAKKLAKKADGDRYINFGGPGFLPSGFLPGYAPGSITRIDEDLPTSILLPKDADIVLQMHYHPIGHEVDDKPQIGLYFSDTPPERNVAMFLMANNDIDIPAGDSSFIRKDSFQLPVDFEVRTIWGHMHLIGKTLKSWAITPDGQRKSLIDIPAWDFNWQDTYFFKQLFLLPKGSVVHTEWTWDNSDNNPSNPHVPSQRIKWGEGSEDEMSGLIVGGVTAKSDDEGWFWFSVLTHYLKVEWAAERAAKKRLGKRERRSIPKVKSQDD
jgi:hypothetical protein